MKFALETCPVMVPVAKNGAGYDNESYLVDLGTSCSVSGDFAIRSFIVNSTNDEEVYWEEITI